MEWIQEAVYSGIIGAIVGMVVTGFLGWVAKGLFTRPHIRALEKKHQALEKEIREVRATRKGPAIYHVSGDQFVMDSSPVARFPQGWTALDKFILLDNGQVLTFFVPTVNVEFAGDRKPIELPQPDLATILAAIDNAVSSMETQSDLKMLPELRIKPDTLRKMLAEAEADPRNQVAECSC